MYTEKVMDHFHNPRNQGVIENADAIGQVGNPTCGDIMKVYLKISDDKASEPVIEDIKFETLGCGAAIATSSMLTEMVKGKTVSDALKIEKLDIAKELGGLPEPKLHCSILAHDALAEAIKNYRNK